MTKIYSYLLILMMPLMAAFCIPSKKQKIFLMGDSTMCNYELARAPVTGWGMPFTHFFDSSITVENHARGGRSTRTFISEKRWAAVEEKLNQGDYVLIQFGHNDEAKEEKYKDRYTPVPDYILNLEAFIKGSRAKGAKPVLITPVTRMRFDKEGNIQETHKEYSAAVIETGRMHNVPVIDLDKKSRDLLQSLGPEQSQLLFMQLAQGEHPNYPEGQKDNTHFNEYGARLIAQLVLQGIKELDLDIATKVVRPNKK